MIFEDFVIQPSDMDDALTTDHVVVMRRIKFPAPVRNLTMSADAFKNAAAQDKQLTLEASGAAGLPASGHGFDRPCHRARRFRARRVGGRRHIGTVLLAQRTL